MDTYMLVLDRYYIWPYLWIVGGVENNRKRWDGRQIDCLVGRMRMVTGI